MSTASGLRGSTALSSPSSPAGGLDAFLHLLQSATGRPLFFEHLRTGFSEHHLLFWEQVQQYRRIAAAASMPSQSTTASSPLSQSTDDGPLPTPLQKAASISARFVVIGAPMQINITEQARLRIQHAITAATSAAASNASSSSSGSSAASLPVSLFDESEKVCIELMKGNYYRTFRETADYRLWMAEEKKQLKLTAAKGAGAAGKRRKSLCTIL